jgi:hypothetical protein
MRRGVERRGLKMPSTDSSTRNALRLAAVLALAALGSCSANVPAPAPAVADRRAEASELVTLKGVRVLRLRGLPRERGYAHGHELAESILAVFALYRPFLAPDDAYERRVRPEVRDRFRFPPEVAEELAGMFEGMRAKLGDEGFSGGPMESFGRPFDELDLRCMQAIPDWYQLHCSAFVAWGALSPGGPIVGRNVDFGYHPVLAANHLLVYSERSGGKRAWVSLTFPGIVGAITGMNEDGVCVFTLDANAPLVDLSKADPSRKGMLPRLLECRRILEGAGPDDPAHDGLRLLEGVPTRWGQNIFVAGPRVADDPGTAGVIERSVGGTALRTAADDPVAAGVPAFACTNHLRRLAKPVSCDRYDTVAARMRELQAAGSTVDENEAFRLLWDVKQKYMTLQAVVVEPRTRGISLRLVAEPLLIVEPRLARFTWDEIAGVAKWRPAANAPTTMTTTAAISATRRSIGYSPVTAGHSPRRRIAPPWDGPTSSRGGRPPRP